MGGEHTYEVIDGAASVLEAMVTGIDVATLTGPGATRLAERLVRAERVLAACRARAVRRATEANQWRHAGERSPAAWAARLTGTSTGQAAAELETTRRLEALPATAAARATGAISDLQARELAAAATADPTAEAALLRHAAVDDAARFKRRCADVRAAAVVDEAAARARIRKARRFRHWFDAEGAFCFAGRGLAEDGAALLAAMKPCQDAAFHAARRRGEHDHTEAYAYDGLMGMAHHQCPPSTVRPGAATRTRTTATTSTTGSPDGRAGRATTTNAGPMSAVGRTATHGEPQQRTGAERDSRRTDRPAGTDPGATTSHTTSSHAPSSGIGTLFDAAPARPSATAPASTATTPGEGTDPSGLGGDDRTTGDELVHDRDAVLAQCFRPGPRAKLIVRIDHTALLRGHTVPGETCEIAGIGPIPVSTARQLARDAFLTAVVTDGVDIRTVAHLGRAATAHQRTALQARGMRCAVPGCGLVHGLEIDHVDGWAITKRTHIDQLDWLCHFHHGQKTHHSYRLAGPPGNRTWHPPDRPTPDTSRPHRSLPSLRRW